MDGRREPTNAPFEQTAGGGAGPVEFRDGDE